MKKTKRAKQTIAVHVLKSSIKDRKRDKKMKRHTRFLQMKQQLKTTSRSRLRMRPYWQLEVGEMEGPGGQYDSDS